jgi:hypothetical protein
VMQAPLIFASSGVTRIVAGFNRMDPAARERLVVLGALLLVSAVAVLLIVLFRKRHHHHHSHERSADVPRSGPAPEGKRRKWRRRRRDHRPRNPTLAETGGLPPIRDSQPPPSA